MWTKMIGDFVNLRVELFFIKCKIFFLIEDPIYNEQRNTHSLSHVVFVSQSQNHQIYL